MKTALRMNDPHFAMCIYEEAGDVYFKGHRNRMASLPFYRVRGTKNKIHLMHDAHVHTRHDTLFSMTSSHLFSGWQSAVCTQHQGHPFRVPLVE